ncbi:MAG: hypothetical protein ACE5JB_10520 [bacterium]
MKNKSKVFIKLLLILIFSNTLRGEIVSRHILALYNSEQGQTTKINHIHANAEVILNHLGCVVDYWDIKDGLPDQKIMQKYLGVITWFYNNSIKQPEKYLNWASQQIVAKRKFVILGNIGAFKDATNGKDLKIDVVNNFCKRLGFIVDDENLIEDVTKIELVYKDANMVEFERSLNYELNYYSRYRSTNSKNKVYLKLKLKGKPNSESDMVITSPNGGFVDAGYIIYQDENTFKRKWRINPFKFFEEAFGLKAIPKSDVTTLNGSRIWVSHIDGDALISRSEVKPNAYCGEIIRDEILKKYKWPVSVSVVVGEVERDPKFVEIARSIFRIEWVEAASHSYAHPFYWEDDYAEKDKYPSRHLPIKGYTFDLKKEIIGSVNYINKNLLPIDKKVKQFFWTGNCVPTPEALGYCNKINISNINGGDSIFDNYAPSYTSLAPLGVIVGGYRQLYAPNASENIYTNDWTGPYYGFKFVLETFKNTESPIRIKPINIYYHYYSGERWAGLNALKEVIEKTITKDVAPMFISDYIAMVKGFYSTQIEKISKDRWRIKNYGKCTTMRFDNTQKYPDFEKSSGILGFLHYQGSLYLHLDNQDEAVIALTESKPKVTYLEQGSHRIFNWHSSNKEISFKTEGFGKGKFVIANVLRNKKYKVSITDLKSNLKDKTNSFNIQSDFNRRLTFLRPMEGPIAVNISLGQ